MSPQQRRENDGPPTKWMAETVSVEEYEIIVTRILEIAGVEGVSYDQVDALIEAKRRINGNSKWKEVEAEYNRLAANLAFA